MANEAVGIAGTLLLLALSFLCMYMCGKALVRTFRSGRTFDWQLGKVDESDHPNLFGMHILGFAALIVICVFIQLSLLTAIFQHLVTD